MEYPMKKNGIIKFEFVKNNSYCCVQNTVKEKKLKTEEFRNNLGVRIHEPGYWHWGGAKD